VLSQQDVSCLDLSEAASYDSELRRKIKPFWGKINSAQDLKEAKKRLVTGTQKRTLDVMAWYVHRPIENRITHYLSELPLTPNQLTIFTNILAFFITFLFFKGYLLIASLLIFVVNIMDGLDGKQARAKGLFTHVGNLEHSLDTLYEQSWYIAFSWAIFTISRSFLPLQLCLVIILFDSFNRHCSMQFRAVMGVPLADYSPFDRAFRRFDGRRNIYTVYILVGILIGQPVYSLLAMSIHAIVTGLVYFLRSARHMHAADMGR
jgi:phosphatidylglycerophosphate synthase